MKTREQPRQSPLTSQRDAATLLELLGVVAVFAILASALIPATIRHLDRLATEQETASLAALARGLQTSILDTRSIPCETNWASQIAGELGMAVAGVTNNPRNETRVFVADPSGWLSTNFPYTQTYTGTSVRPDNARVMLISSLGAPLPLASGMLSAAAFSSLWDATPGTLPATAPWTTWSGRADDVIIQRINLSPLFVNLVLGTYTANSNGQYSVDSETGPLYPAPRYSGVGAYYLKGTVLRLYTGAPASQTNATQILSQDCSFVYEAGVWKGSIEGGETFGLGDIAGVVTAFLSAAPNTNAANGSTQQVMAVQAMVNYMSNYNLWAAGSFSDNNLKNYLKNTAQPNMMSAVQGLYSGVNYPTNGAPCP